MAISSDDASEVKSILLAAEDPDDRRSTEHYRQFRNRRESRDPKDLSLYGDSPLLPVRLEKDPQANSADVRYHLSGLSDESAERRKKLLLRKIDQAQEQRDKISDPLQPPSSIAQSGGNDSANETISKGLAAKTLNLEKIRNEIKNAPIKNPLEFLDMELAQRPDKESLKSQIDDKVREALSRIPDDVLQKKRISQEGLFPPKLSQAIFKSEIQERFSVESFDEKISKGIESVSQALSEAQGITGKRSGLMSPIPSGSEISQEKFDAIAKIPEQLGRTIHFYPPPLVDPEQSREKRAKVLERLKTHRNFRDWELRGANLSGLDLSKCDFSGADLIGCDLSGSNLSDSDFSGAWGAHANLVKSIIDRVNFSSANLGCADLSFSTGTRLTFKETILTGAAMANCVLSDSRFEKADFSNVSFVRSKLQNCYFSHSRFMKIRTMPQAPESGTHPGADPDRLFFDETDFSGSLFEKALFMKIDFRRVCFSGSILSQATFLDCKGPESRFDQATLRKTAFPQCLDFSRSTFRGADLTGANLRGMNLAESDFCESVLNALDGSEGNWHRAKISGSKAIKARFQKTDLSHVDARGTDFRQAIFGKANLLFADFSHASLYKAGFTGAQIDDSTRWDHALTGKTTLE